MPETTEDIRAMVRERFRRMALTPEQEKRFPAGPESAKRLGYNPREIDALPRSVTESFCGVGNPLGLGEVHPGETVLDLGCGAGLDSLLAARRVGAAGKVIGVDMTEAMLAKARQNAASAGMTNVAFLHGNLENLPLENESVDVAISNGVFNLCPDKPRSLAETYRVLKPGGRLLMADILLEDDVSAEEAARLGTWSD
jgi:SAM-dependent methyltransferase